MCRLPKATVVFLFESSIRVVVCSQVSHPTIPLSRKKRAEKKTISKNKKGLETCYLSSNGLDLLLGLGALTETVLEATVDIGQVAHATGTGGLSADGLLAPVVCCSSKRGKKRYLVSFPMIVEWINFLDPLRVLALSSCRLAGYKHTRLDVWKRQVSFVSDPIAITLLCQCAYRCPSK